MIYADVLREIQVNPAERAFWEYVAKHCDPCSDIDARLREDERRANAAKHQRAKKLRAAVRRIIRRALKGQSPRWLAAINIAGEILKLFFWPPYRPGLAEFDVSREEPDWFEVAAEVAAEIVASGLHFNDAQHEVYAVLSERGIGVPSGIFFGVGVAEKAPQLRQKTQAQLCASVTTNGPAKNQPVSNIIDRAAARRHGATQNKGGSRRG